MSSLVTLTRRTALLQLGCLMATPLLAQPVPTRTELELLKSGSPTHRFSESTVTSPNGRRYRLFIAMPKRKAPAGGRPILYMLDGNAAFDALTPDQLAQAPDLAIVAVGYETDLRFDVLARTFDYTPPLSATGPTQDTRHPDRPAGGANQFRDFLVQGLRSNVEKELQIATDKRALWGHSYGGLFTLHTLFSAPTAFARYIPVSPSLWWGDGCIVKEETNATRLASGHLDVLVMLGDRESPAPPKEGEKAQPAPETMSMIDRLTHRSDLRVQSRVLSDANHGDAFLQSIPFALQRAHA